MHIGKSSNSDAKKYPPDSLMGRLRERKIIATLAAFAGSGVVIIEVAHHILVNHYHFPHQTVDICIVTLAGALLGTLIWQWFRGSAKRPGNVKVEVLVVPLIILLTLVIDLKFIFKMTGISTNMLLIGIAALCLGITWVVFKSLQWAASAPGSEKKVEVLKPTEKKPTSSPEWKNSIAVLPFTNISADLEQEYFCDGLSEELINVADGYHLWSERFDRELVDVFDIQDKISLAITEKLKIKLLGEGKEKLTKRNTNDVKSYNIYLKALYLRRRLKGDDLHKSIELFNLAIDEDPDNALAWAGLSYAQRKMISVLNGWKKPM